MSRIETVFIGGPGRSGTSFVADRLARHPQTCAFTDVELKLFAEKGGLLDLWHSLGETYSPNRASVALQQFNRLCLALIKGQFGQRPLVELAAESDWQATFLRFTDQLTVNGHAVPVAKETFFPTAAQLLSDLGELAANQQPASARPRMFVEKTPHTLLALDFINRIDPQARFVHVMRDPRSIAWSLTKMRWAPDELAACCTWVESYCKAWTAVRTRARSFQPNLQLLNIETIAVRPDPSATAVCKALDLDCQPALFRGADIATLNGWTAKCSAVEIDEMSERLAAWVTAFGYDLAEIGRCTGSSPGVETAPETVGA
ncbi:MAG: sulfotransferase [Pseudomonadota bacterium]